MEEADEITVQVATNLVTLQTCLTTMMGKAITMDQLRQDVGNMVEKITKVIAIFRQFQLKMEEYVCLKVIAMVSQDGAFNAFSNNARANETSMLLLQTSIIQP